MPCGEQADIDIARLLVKLLDIRSTVVNVKDAVDGVLNRIKGIDIYTKTRTNLPPRIRMAT